MNPAEVTHSRLGDHLAFKRKVISGEASTTTSSLNPKSIIQWDAGRQRRAKLSIPDGWLTASSYT